MFHKQWSIHGSQRKGSVYVYAKVPKKILGFPVTAQRHAVLPVDASEQEVCNEGIRLLRQIKP